MALREEPDGFTVLELLIAIAIMSILATLTFALVSGLRARAQRVQCVANLKTLAIGANLYIQENNMWPQINVVANADKTEEEMAALWIAALEPFSVPRQSWICPTKQELLHRPDYTQPGEVRVDYAATSFDDKPASPHQWPRQPWFVESADVHGNGNLMIFTDGSVSDLNSVTSGGQ